MQGSPAGSQTPQPLLTGTEGTQPLLNPRQSLARTKSRLLQKPQTRLCFSKAGRRLGLLLMKGRKREY